MKAIKVLKALHFGQEVEIDGRIYGLGERDEGGFDLIVKGTSWASGEKPFVDKGKVIWLDANMPLNSFISLCEKISDDDLFILGAERALTIMRRGPKTPEGYYD
jgi:hypothetical protein